VHPNVRRSLIAGAGLIATAGVVAAAVLGSRGSPPHPSATTSTTKGSAVVAHHEATTTTSTTRPPTVTISAVGDFNFGSTPSLPPDPATYFQDVRSALQGQIVFGNLEGTLTDSGSTSKCAKPSPTCYAFRAPTSYASIIRAAGFTVVNSANNHSHDFGVQGVAATSAALDAAGIVQAGLPGQIGMVTVGSVKVAFVDFAPYAVTNDLLDLATARTLIMQAKSEANVVVVYMHAGAEGETADHVTGHEEYFVGEDRGNPEAFAHAAIDAGADLVIASGPHTLRGMELYRGHLIDYSLGDFAGYADFSTTGTLDLSGVLTVTLTAGGTLVSGHFTSLLLSGVDQPSLDPSNAAAAFVNRLSAEDFGSNAVTISASGQLSMPASAG
jgi:poly-gamma-glutamate capsule biosynthesis protein CapA/YwtB (metallophosphatase superfamily)